MWFALDTALAASPGWVTAVLPGIEPIEPGFPQMIAALNTDVEWALGGAEGHQRGGPPEMAAYVSPASARDHIMPGAIDADTLVAHAGYWRKAWFERSRISDGPAWAAIAASNGAEGVLLPYVTHEDLPD